MFTIDGKYTKALITIDNIEPECLAQIGSMVNNVAFSNQVVIMPDTHSGKGSVIGFTMKMGDKIIPNIVGVDIGCGMLSCDIGKVNLSENDHKMLDDYIRRNVPFGMNVREGNVYAYGINGVEIVALCKKIGMDPDYAMKSIGTLGGGNHFIEIGKSVNTEHIWITVHTGSRNLGKRVCEYWQRVATDRAYRGESKEDGIKRIKSSFPKSEWQKEIVNLKNNIKKHRSTGLEYLEGEDLKGYLKDMAVCQHYAKMNRYEIMEVILNYLIHKSVPEKTVETVHNYINFGDDIIRKGAISSYKGIEMIIPLNMRDGILLCIGKSNSDWNCSAPHGAGRVLSRSKAKQVVDLDEFRETMKGVFSTSVGQGTLDESPFAYKDSTMIEEAIGPTADIVDRIIPLHNMKDSDGERE
jgi:RNA-splicing ligase RtcB